MIVKDKHLLKNIVERLRLEHSPSHIREKLRHANVGAEARKKLEHQYDRLLQGKSIPKTELKDFLHTIADRKVVDLHSGTHLGRYSSKESIEHIINQEKYKIKAETYERRQEQMHVEEEQLKTLEHQKEEEGKEKKKKATETLAHHAPVGVPQGHTPQMKDGKAPLPKHIKAV